jgi:RNA polymerase sigma-70 factor (ECF subfamily)
MINLNEEMLVDKAKSGDKIALEILLKDNYNIVYGYLIKLCFNVEVSKDLTQETMVKAIINIKGFKGKSKFSTWLVSIASNLYKDSLKKKFFLGFKKDLIEYDENPEDIFIKNENFEKIKKALLKLPVEKRKVFVLKHYYNYSYEEIAEILKCPIGTVKSRLYYCIKKLSIFLEGDVL